MRTVKIDGCIALFVCGLICFTIFESVMLERFSKIPIKSSCRNKKEILSILNCKD